MIDRCVKKVGLGERCFTTKQCSSLNNFAECRFGTCQCLCGFKETVCPLDIIRHKNENVVQNDINLLGVGGVPRCANPDDPLNINTFINGVEHLFGPKQSLQRTLMGN